MKTPASCCLAMLVLSVLSVTGCAGPQHATPIPVTSVVVPLDTVLSVYTGSPYKERFRGLITNQEAWSALWSYVANHYPMHLHGAVPRIDFDRFQLLVVAPGSPGHASTSLSVRDSASARHVHVRTNRNGPNCLETTDIQTPVHVVRLPRSSAPLIYHDTSAVDDCPPFNPRDASSSH